jgi:hypothetical protein
MLACSMKGRTKGDFNMGLSENQLKTFDRWLVENLNGHLSMFNS